MKKQIKLKKRSRASAMLFVVLFTSSALGLTLISNKIIVHDIIQTATIDKSTVAYYQAEGNAEQALLDSKKGIELVDANVTVGGQDITKLPYIVGGPIAKNDFVILPCPDALKNKQSINIAAEFVGGVNGNSKINFSYLDETKSMRLYDLIDSNFASATTGGVLVGTSSLGTIPASASFIIISALGADISKYIVSPERPTQNLSINLVEANTLSSTGTDSLVSRNLKLDVIRSNKSLNVFGYTLFNASSTGITIK